MAHIRVDAEVVEELKRLAWGEIVVQSDGVEGSSASRVICVDDAVEEALEEKRWAPDESLNSVIRRELGLAPPGAVELP